MAGSRERVRADLEQQRHNELPLQPGLLMTHHPTARRAWLAGRAVLVEAWGG